jgi:hypothetical protein
MFGFNPFALSMVRSRDGDSAARTLPVRKSVAHAKEQ